MRLEPISCWESDEKRRGLEPASSLTNFIAGEVVDPRLPPMTVTTWARSDGLELLRDEIDEDGCRHWEICHEPETYGTVNS